MGESQVVTTEIVDPDDSVPLVRRYRCRKCHWLAARHRDRCGACAAIASMVEIDLPGRLAVLRPTAPYRDRIRRRGGNTPDGIPYDPTEDDVARLAEEQAQALGPDPDGEVDEDEPEDNDTPEDIAEVPSDKTPRKPTGLADFDAIFDGGLPHPSVIMFGATPGLGKSRLTLEIAARRAQAGSRTMVVCVEEPKPKVSERGADMRLSTRFPRAYSKGRLQLYKTHSLELLIARLDESKVDLVVVDSVFMLESSEVPGQAGDPVQLAHCVKKLYNRAQGTDEYQGCRPCTMILIAHGTKSNIEAGTNRVKHWIDAALFGERTHADGTPRADQRRPIPKGEEQWFRVFCTGKNRYGAADGVAHMVMTRPHGIPAPYTPATITDHTPLRRTPAPRNGGSKRRPAREDAAPNDDT